MKLDTGKNWIQSGHHERERTSMKKARPTARDRGDAPAPEAPRDFDAVYHEIRRRIIEGVLPSGSAVSQLELTRMLGVSRTPIREALRRLQAEGLLDSEPNRRMRVTGISPDELDAIYSTRIFLESMAVALSVPRMTDADLDELARASRDIDWSCTISDSQRHDRQLSNFKLMAMKYAGEGVRRSVSEQFDRCERVRKIYQGVSTNAAFAREEHNALLDAYLRRATDDAVFVASRHLGRTALAVLGYFAPDYEPRAIRHALAKAATAGLGGPTSVLSLVGEGPAQRSRITAAQRKGAAGE